MEDDVDFIEAFFWVLTASWGRISRPVAEAGVKS
jgi:hypothetical protein